MGAKHLCGLRIAKGVQGIPRMKPVSKPTSPYGRLVASSLSMAAVLVVPLVMLVGVTPSGVAIAQQDPGICQQIFQQERAKCNTLTGIARAVCQRLAAENFRHCRGQASPTSLAAGNSSAILSPTTDGGAPVVFSPPASASLPPTLAPNGRARLLRTKELDRFSRLRARYGQ